MTSRDEALREVRRRLTPDRLVTGLSLQRGAKRQPGGWLVLCPAHSDSTPSCSISLGDDETTRVRCFGCDLAGDALVVVAAKLGLDAKSDFARVLVEAGRVCGVDVPPLGAGVSRTERYVPGTLRGPRATPVPPVVPTVVPSQNTQGTTGTEPAAPTRLPGGGWLLANCPLERSVGVGLAFAGLLEEALADGWGELPEEYRAERPDLERGARSSSGAPDPYDVDDLALARLLEHVSVSGQTGALSWLLQGGRPAHPQHRLLIPWRAPDGGVWTLQRRWAPLYGDEAPPKGVPKYVFPSTQVYNPRGAYPYGIERAELEDCAELWVVEGARDVLAVRALAALEGRGGLAVLGLPGVARWRELAPQVLRYARGRVVCVALDDDEAGNKAAVQVCRDVWRAGASKVRRSRPGRGCKDWAELLRVELSGGPEGRAA